MTACNDQIIINVLLWHPHNKLWKQSLRINLRESKFGSTVVSLVRITADVQHKLMDITLVTPQTEHYKFRAHMQPGQKWETFQSSYLSHTEDCEHPVCFGVKQGSATVPHRDSALLNPVKFGLKPLILYLLLHTLFWYIKSSTCELCCKLTSFVLGAEVTETNLVIHLQRIPRWVLNKNSFCAIRWWFWQS